MPDAASYSLNQAMQALKALHSAAASPPEQFPLPAFVGMISDRSETLRVQGKSDAGIATIIRSSGIDNTPEQFAEHDAATKQRHRPRGG